MLIHIFLDAWSKIPAVILYLISTKMNILIFKATVHIFKNFFHGLPSQVYCWIKLTIVNIVAFYIDILVFLTAAPRLSMSRGINLWNNSYSSQLSISYHHLNIYLTVYSSNTAVLTDLRYLRYVERKTILIDNMPMKYIKFRIKHAIYCMF